METLVKVEKKKKEGFTIKVFAISPLSRTMDSNLAFTFW